jgi:xanthine dehydrogenase YagT iron-sulfur-binding subunit
MAEERVSPTTRSAADWAPAFGAAPEPITMPVQLRINGVERAVTVDTRMSLLDLLREELHLTGTKKGCDHGQCGACTVLAGGRRINACMSFAVMHDGAEIVTVESLAADGVLHPLQAAFIAHDGFQCGYCTPGQICAAIGMLAEVDAGIPSAVTPDVAARFDVSQLTDAEIRERMSGNLCRCGAYSNIVGAIQTVAVPGGRGDKGGRR